MGRNDAFLDVDTRVDGQEPLSAPDTTDNRKAIKLRTSTLKESSRFLIVLSVWF